jgi:hypothetical protein
MVITRRKKSTKWTLIQNAEGYYHIKGVWSGLVLGGGSDQNFSQWTNQKGQAINYANSDLLILNENNV